MAQYCPLPGQFLAIARQETTRREEAEDRRRKKVREGGREKKIAEERKRLLSLLLFTLHQIVWNPDKHWGSERWRVGSPLHHSSPLFTTSPLGVPPDLKSGVKKCPNLFRLCGFAIRSKGVCFSFYWGITNPQVFIGRTFFTADFKSAGTPGGRSWSPLKTEAGHHWRPKLVTIEGRRPKPDSREDLASSKKIRVKSGWRVVKRWANSSPSQTPFTQQFTPLRWRVKSKIKSSFLFTRYEQKKGRLTSSQGLPPYTYS